jgi:hypothetical protein
MNVPDVYEFAVVFRQPPANADYPLPVARAERHRLKRSSHHRPLTADRSRTTRRRSPETPRRPPVRPTSGDPNGKGLPVWPQFLPQYGNAMMLGDRVEPVQTLSADRIALYDFAFARMMNPAVN